MNNSKTCDSIYIKHNLKAFLYCSAAVGLNMLFSFVVAAFELPLYLDTVGTVVVAIMGGYLPGVLVGFLTNIIKVIIDPSAIYYGFINVLIAVVAAFFAERKWHKKIRGVIGLILIITIIGGGMGALIPWFMEGLTFDTESLSGIIYSTGLFNSLFSHIISSIIKNIMDKGLTVIIALIILYFLPNKLYDRFRFNIWRQAPLTNEEANSKKTGEVRRISLRIKVLVVLVFSLTTVGIVSTILSVNINRKMTIKQEKRMTLGVASLVSELVDGDLVDDYLKTGGDMDEYRKTKEAISKILYSSPDISYLYVYKIEPKGFRVIFDIDTEDTPAEEIGTFIPFDAYFEQYKDKLLKGEEVEPIITNDEYGYLLTAARPVFNSDGRCVCYAIADVDMEIINANSRSFLTEMISVFLGFFILLCVFTIWVTDYHVIIPINTLVKSMDKMASTKSATQEVMDEDVRMFRNLAIVTGDEIENLYAAASAMTKNQAEQLRSIRRLSDSTAKMQDGLIMTMADLVENRDSDTGAHVQKTAAYVKIIVEGLKKKGYYAYKITPKFISDVVRSAPLHDIGKINIPDNVLNKPGKLTDEEYEIMKTHTIAGKRIMEKAIKIVEGDNYLKEARNMAAYHHERWDGKGYPEGLHGEVIPLSARIMAIADVFDALTSARVYKPAFPIEKALAILEEGAGTQFDPKCVEVFMDALPEVKVILRKYNKEI